jgi:SAM-dependent methyltransferase
MAGTDELTGSDAPAVEKDGAHNLLERIRAAEFDLVRDWFKPGIRVLELGGGTGYQASQIAALGSDVLSIDLADRHKPYHLFHPVQDYDGYNIPAPDASVDVVFSSNTLEHVPDVGRLLRDTRRVLRPEGVALHIVPTAAWRFWNSAAVPPYALKQALGLQRFTPGMVEQTSAGEAARRRGWAGMVGRALKMPFAPHGAYANAVAELHYFSARRWRRVFADAGFRVADERPNRVFYTGLAVAPGTSIAGRRRLARVLGNACRVYVLRKDAGAGE